MKTSTKCLLATGLLALTTGCHPNPASDLPPATTYEPKPWVRVDSLFGTQNSRVTNVQTVNNNLILTTVDFVARVDPDRERLAVVHNLGWRQERFQAVPFVSGNLVAYVAPNRTTLDVVALNGPNRPATSRITDFRLSAPGGRSVDRAQFDAFEYYQSVVVNERNQALIAINFTTAPQYYYLVELESSGNVKTGADGNVAARLINDPEGVGAIYGSFATRTGFLVGYLRSPIRPGQDHRLSQLHRIDANGNVTYVLPNVRIAAVSTLADGIYAYGTPSDSLGNSGPDCFYRSTDDGRSWAKLDWPVARGLATRLGGMWGIGGRPVYVANGVFPQEIDPVSRRVRQLDRTGLADNLNMTSLAEYKGYVYVTTLGGLYRRPIKDFFTYVPQ